MSALELARDLFFQGLDCLQRADFVQAEARFRASLSHLPDRPSTLTNLAASLLPQRKFEEARAVLQQVLASQPDSVAALLHLAQAERGRGDLAAAIACYQQALGLAPETEDAWAGLAGVAYAHKEYALALSACDHLLSRSVQNIDACLMKAAALNAMQRAAQALEVCQFALQVAPRHAELWANMGNALHTLRRWEDAVAAYRRALEEAPARGEIWSCLGNALFDLRRYDEALAAHEQAIHLAPDYAPAWSNRANTLVALCRHEEALCDYEKALALQPDYESARWNLGLTQLMLEQFAAGWANFESRWTREYADSLPDYSAPMLKNLDNAMGKRVLVWCEQGMGDTLQFCRYIPLLIERGIHPVFVVPGPLRQLMQSLAGAECLTEGDAVPEVDYQCPLMSLPGLFATDLASIPARVPYLAIAQAEVERWRTRLGAEGSGLKIGLACSGNPAQKNDGNRSMPMHWIAPLLALGRVYLLQKEIRPADQAFLQANPQIVDLSAQIQSFTDTAALVQCMDVVVSVDTSLSHLAGALARPLHVLLTWSPDWRWSRTGTECPWYPSARLHRQPAAGDWGAVVASVCRVLAQDA